MLLELHVKNLALIEKVDVEFGGGLNILTGETGAGKSILIGSVNIALGGKVPKDIIRKGAEYAYIELIFSVTEKEKIKALENKDVNLTEDNLLIISKKIMSARSVSKINDETVTAAKLREITSLFIDIHGQHEHQSLLHASKHLEILDEYAKAKTQPVKLNIATEYHAYQDLAKRLEGYQMNEEERLRQADFYRFEIDEIENAALKEDEEEELTEKYRRFTNGQRIVSALSSAYEAVNNAEIDKALKEVTAAAEYDKGICEIRDQLFDIESILSDVNHEISGYLDDLVFDEEEYHMIEGRLDLIHNLQAKYGNTASLILEKLEDKKRKLEELVNYDILCQNTEKKLEKTRKKLEQLCGQLSEIRRESAKKLVKKIKAGLTDLNFIDVMFSMEFTKLDHFTAGGFDTAEFMISTNPGESLKPLGMVASGGELSRIMLAIKTVLADSDDIPTLIFDEIDAGISGRTAQKVSEKLAYIAKSHQVLCITHLPQIAAMADCHYEIAKSADGNKTTTVIKALGNEEMVTELARLLGGARITDAVLQNAREMKELAGKVK